MRLVETRKGESQKTIQHYHRRWLLLVLGRMAEKVMIIRLMFTTSLRSYREEDFGCPVTLYQELQRNHVLPGSEPYMYVQHIASIFY
jgi:hypothetical protein